MHLQTKTKGITFAVHDVEPVLSELPNRKTRDGFKMLLKDFDPPDANDMLYCSGYNSDSLDDIDYHSLFSAFQLAFSQHRPLVLSPDMIWITILQGFAQHVRNNKEELRHLFVDHKGKKRLEIYRTDILPGSPENSWDSVIHDFSNLLREQNPDNYTKFVSDFSTTGELERIVSEISILDVFQSYYEYVLCCVCGFPEITLEGTSDDWHKLRKKVDMLEPYKLDWWLVHLKKITEQFHRASSGDVDREFWQNIYKLKHAYGCDRINGWIVKLVPYVKMGWSGECVIRNPALTEDPCIWDEDYPRDPGYGHGGIQTNVLPSGLAQVPFTMKDLKSNESKLMQFLAGFVGAEQDPFTKAIRPMLGWAVREAPQSLQYLHNLPPHIVKTPPQPAERLEEFLTELMQGRRLPLEIPGCLSALYKECDGLSYDSGQGWSWRILSLSELSLVPEPSVNEPASAQAPSPVAEEEEEEPESYADTNIEVIEAPVLWLRFLDECNGSYTAVALNSYKAEFNVSRFDPTTGKSTIIAPSLEQCVRDYIAKSVFS